VAGDVYEPLQRYLRRRASAADAADVLSESLLTVWRRLDDVPTDDPLPWCYGVARRCLANHRRGDDRRRRLDERIVAHRLPEHSGDPQARIERLDPELDGALRQLTLAEQEIVRLWAWEQLEPREIAVVLGQTPNAVSVALTRARRKLAAQLTDSHTPRQDPLAAGQERDGDTVELKEET
jgi:RNA polymerase sigma-70 factor (ECF subfamily)